MRDKFDLKRLTNEIPLADFLRYDEPLLVSKTNAVSGKLLLASEVEKFDTVGYDSVAVGVNDMLAMGAKPILYYDNISCARPKFERVRELETGIEGGCREAEIPFAGSEIKELPDIFSYDQYDLVGFVAGVVERRKQIVPQYIEAGDVIIGLPSNGLHNNGYVAARKKLYLSKHSMEIYYDSLGATLAELLMAPTKMYRRSMEALLDSGISVKSCVQVAHGGLSRAVRLLLREGTGAVIKQREDDIPPLYHMLHMDGNINMETMRATFNMGIGMLLLFAEKDVDQAVEILENAGEEPLGVGLAECRTDEIRYI